MLRRAVVLLLVASALVAPRAAAELRPTAREGARHAVPLFGTVVHAWDAPDDNPFAAGHRGIDVAAPSGTPVRASAPGLVTFAGTVAGNRNVSVDHEGAIRTTYSFLASIAVKKGATVEQGDVVGTVGAGHPGSGLPPHVHLSARRDGVYFDPVWIYLGSSESDLLAIVG
jgi:murein DD-endopeptidase MepM/ murein hydrolase activator NlpD